MPTLFPRDYRNILIALAIYITSLIAANTLGIKIMPMPLGLHLSVGVFMFPVVFIMTDVIGEIYGKQMAKYFVYAGILSTALFLAYNLISVATPWAAEGAWAQSSYDTIFGVSARFSIASLIAYAVGEYQDVLSFFFVKARIGKWFWLRSTLSNVWSQLFDTVLFMTIALYGVYPTPVLLKLMVSWWLFKIAMGILYTPLSYLGLYILRKEHAPA
jgi:uncharacterized integral membrane protein (TIGR00697 family)